MHTQTLNIWPLSPSSSSNDFICWKVLNFYFFKCENVMFLLCHYHLTLFWSQQQNLTNSNTRLQNESVCTSLFVCWTVGQNVSKIASKQKHNNERAIKVASTPGQLCLLIKQGIMGLQGGSHYRPLEESSGRCRFVS